MKSFNRKMRILSLLIIVCISLGCIGFPVMASDLSALADDFCRAVSDIANAADLVAKEEKLSFATEKLEAYRTAGGEESDDAISDSYASYILYKNDIEGTVAACASFIEYVRLASEAERYSDIRGYLDAAKTYISKIDMSYTGVSGMRSLYNSLNSDLAPGERSFKNFSDSVAAGLSMEKYSQMKAEYDKAATFKREITRTDYPNYNKVVEDFEKLSAALDEKMQESVPFIVAVQQLHTSDNFRAALISAFSLYESIDETTEGVASAKAELDAVLSDYNSEAEDANAMIEAANKLAISFIFG